MQSVVVHVRGQHADAVEAGLTAVRDLQAAIPAAVVELVVQGGAVADLAVSHSAAIESGDGDGDGGSLAICACANSLQAVGMSAGDLAESVRIVSSPVAHAAERQWGGWAYVRI